MKKQIVITLNKDKNGFVANIFGKVGNKKTDAINGWFADQQQAINCISCKYNMNKIKEWMEQIA